MPDTLPSSAPGGTGLPSGSGASGSGSAGEWLTVEPQYFAPVPEWVIDSEVSDAAFRVYAVLMRYGDSSGRRMPSRAALARRLHRSADSVDRALRELESAGLVEVERRRAGRRNLTNLYHLRTSAPTADGAEASAQMRKTAPTGAADNHLRVRAGSRSAATPPTGPQVVDGGAGGGGRTGAATGGRGYAAGVAAELRHDPEVLTQRETSSSQSSSTPAARVPEEEEEAEVPADGAKPGKDEPGVLSACGITDLDALTVRVAEVRRAVGRPSGRWASHCLLAAIQLAVQRGWDPQAVEAALMRVAGDPGTVSPMRLAEAGPWWDTSGPGDPQSVLSETELAEMESELAALDGARVRVQRQARARLEGRGLPVTRATVAREAVRILRSDEIPVTATGQNSLALDIPA